MDIFTQNISLAVKKKLIKTHKNIEKTSTNDKISNNTHIEIVLLNKFNIYKINL